MRTLKTAGLWLLVAPLAVAVPLLAATPGVDAKAEEVLKAAREALGGEKALGKVTALSATGSHRRVFGEREVAGDLTIEVLLPDKMKRTEEMGIPGGPTVSRISALNGDEVWDDTTNRGGGGGFMMRFGGPGGPGGPGGQGQPPSEEDRERFRQMQIRRMKGELSRHLLAFLVQTSAPVSHVGVAEAEDGKADVLEVAVEGGSPMRLFVDQETHQVLMLTYEAALPRMMTRRAGQGERPSPEEMRRLAQEPPQMATFEVRYADYKKVDGVLLPHTIIQSVNGNVTEEWSIDKFKVNPPLKADAFDKKS